MASVEQLQAARAAAEADGNGAAVRRIDAAIAAAQAAGGQYDENAPPAEAPSSGGGGVWDTVSDIAQSIPTGMRRGYEGLAGLGGDIYGLEVSAAEKLAGWMGASPETMAEIRAARGKNWLPTSEDAGKATSEIIGPHRQSTTAAGDIAQTAGGFLTNPSRNILRSVVAPTIGTEVGGYVGDKLGSETMGRLLGGIGGAALPGGTARGIAGPRVSPERRAAINTIQNEGIDITAGQATGRGALKAAEAGPFEGKSAGIAQQQGEQFSRAALQRAGINADRATPEVMNAADDAFEIEYDDLIQRTGGVPLDNDLASRLVQTVDDYRGLTDKTGDAVNTFFTRISNAARDNGGSIPPEVFKVIRGDLSRTMRMSSNPELKQALRQFQGDLYDSIGRNGSPEVVQQWRDVSNRYRNFKIVEKAMGGAGADTRVEKFVTPNKLARATEQGDRGGYVRDRGDMADLANAGEGVMSPLPNSGTAPRVLSASGLAAALYPLLQGDLKTAGTVAASATAPILASKALTARPVRTALIRQATDPLPLIDPMTGALIGSDPTRPKTREDLARQQLNKRQ